MDKSPYSVSERAGGGWAQHLVVGAIACLLTVSIAGSGLYFAVRWRTQQNEEARIEQFVDGLSHRSAAELRDTVTLLRQKPGLAARVLPVMVKRMRGVGNSIDRLGLVRVAAAFAAEEPKIADGLFELRRVKNETIAAEAVAALAGVRPSEEAAERLGRCIDGTSTPAVMDVVCEGLVGLGAAGRKVAEAKLLPRLSVDRRWWLVGLIEARRPPQADEWLGMMTVDASPEVAGRARAALQRRMDRG